MTAEGLHSLLDVKAKSDAFCRIPQVKIKGVVRPEKKSNDPKSKL